MKVTSSAFDQFQPIPRQYTCQGEDVSIPLLFSDVPQGASTVAIIVDDPDAPNGVFTHWVAWNIPPEQGGLIEGQKIPREGKNSFGSIGYRGPCPPPGKSHRYFFKVFALDTVLELQQGASKADLEKAMKGHILAHAELVGTYQKSS